MSIWSSRNPRLPRITLFGAQPNRQKTLQKQPTQNTYITGALRSHSQCTVPSFFSFVFLPVLVCAHLPFVLSFIFTLQLALIGTLRDDLVGVELLADYLLCKLF